MSSSLKLLLHLAFSLVRTLIQELYGVSILVLEFFVDITFCVVQRTLCLATEYPPLTCDEVNSHTTIQIIRWHIFPVW